MIDYGQNIYILFIAKCLIDDIAGIDGFVSPFSPLFMNGVIFRMEIYYDNVNLIRVYLSKTTIQNCFGQSAVWCFLQPSLFHVTGHEHDCPTKEIIIE